MAGWWSTHEFKRHSVGQEFCGWPSLKKIIDSGMNPRDKLLALSLFKTGGRVNEVLSLKPSNFDFEASRFSILVKDMPVQKKWVYEDETRTRTIRKDVKRTFPVVLSEPLSPEWKQMLLASFQENKRDGLLFPIGRNMAWKIVNEEGRKAGLTIWAHWFRGMRASQLVDDYELDINSLNAYFSWAKRKEISSQRYATISWRGLERRMLLALKLRMELEQEFLPELQKAPGVA